MLKRLLVILVSLWVCTAHAGIPVIVAIVVTVSGGIAITLTHPEGKTLGDRSYETLFQDESGARSDDRCQPLVKLKRLCVGRAYPLILLGKPQDTSEGTRSFEMPAQCRSRYQEFLECVRDTKAYPPEYHNWATKELKSLSSTSASAATAAPVSQ